jgi:hypothetical protein
MRPQCFSTLCELSNGKPILLIFLTHVSAFLRKPYLLDCFQFLPRSYHETQQALSDLDFGWVRVARSRYAKSLCAIETGRAIGHGLSKPDVRLLLTVGRAPTIERVQCR